MFVKITKKFNYVKLFAIFLALNNVTFGVEEIKDDGFAEPVVQALSDRPVLTNSEALGKLLFDVSYDDSLREAFPELITKRLFDDINGRWAHQTMDKNIEMVLGLAGPGVVVSLEDAVELLMAGLPESEFTAGARWFPPKTRIVGALNDVIKKHGESRVTNQFIANVNSLSFDMINTMLIRMDTAYKKSYIIRAVGDVDPEGITANFVEFVNKISGDLNPTYKRHVIEELGDVSPEQLTSHFFRLVTLALPQRNVTLPIVKNKIGGAKGIPSGCLTEQFITRYLGNCRTRASDFLSLMNLMLTLHNDNAEIMRILSRIPNERINRTFLQIVSTFRDMYNPDPFNKRLLLVRFFGRQATARLNQNLILAQRIFAGQSAADPIVHSPRQLSLCFYLLHFSDEHLR